MRTQRAIGVFSASNLEVSDEAFRGRTTKQLSEMDFGSETHLCRRYYEDVTRDEIEPHESVHTN
jgi:hypothetical protein